jgi:tetratricopeptide (TPR) repeat protein
MMPGEGTELEPENDEYRLYEESLRLLHEKKYDEAKSLLGRIKDIPGIELEMLARANDLLKVCEKRSQQSTEVDENATSLMDRGVWLHNAGRYSEALDCYDRAREKMVKENLGHVYYGMAASEAALGETEKALQHLRQAIQLRNEIRYMARNDSDFQSLADSSDFRELTRSQEK